MNAREREFVGAEFAALGAEVLCAGVEPVDLLVGGVRDQGYLADVVVFGELRPGLDGVLGCLVSRVRQMESSSGVVVSHRALWFAGPKGLPCSLLVGVL